MSRKTGVILLSLMLAVTLLTGCQSNTKKGSYPTKPIDLVVPQDAGSAPDLAARLTADWLSKKWGQPINVVNRPGGGMIVGTQSVMQAQPDGYTILFDGNGASSFQAMVKEKLPYKWADRTFIARICEAPMVFVSAKSSPLKSLKDVDQRIKSDPSTFKTGWQASTTVTGMTLVKWFNAIGINPSKVKTIEYRASNEAVAAVAGKHIDFTAAGISSAVSMLEAGYIQIIAVASDKKMPSMPDVPTAKEQGYDIVQTFWQGVSGPPGMPREVADKWAGEISKMVADEQFVAKLKKEIQMYPSFLGPQEFKENVLAEAKSIEGVMGIK